MKKLLIITFSTLILLSVLIYISGLETRYFYEDKFGNQNIELIKDSNLKAQLYVVPHDSILQINLVFNNLKKTVEIKTAKVNTSETQKLKLSKVSASDGFYNWVKEKNGEADTFEKLPEHLKLVDKDIEAYFVYSWSFNSLGKRLENIEMEFTMLIDVDNKEIYLKKVIEMKLSKEIVFKSPIRFH